MKRQEAINLIGELDNECKEIVGHSFMLVRPDVKNELASGYQVRVKAKLNKAKLRCIETITDQYGYLLWNEPNEESLLIYEPREKKGFKNTQETLSFGTM